MARRIEITITGIVQGVGFRPYVYNLAVSMGIKGHVANTSEGVRIEAEGEDVQSFLDALFKAPPPLSRIWEYETRLLPVENDPGFRILESSDKGSFTLISPDISVCDNCLKELFDPGDRRYLYPFINCTNCGPRFTITRSVPYDRANTTMAIFKMCPECLAEYRDPQNRRFHAEPNACPVCGPRVELVNSEGISISATEEPIERSISLLKDGLILAIKGLGGFHIACDATNEKTVKRLREKKRKSNKPFALMALNTDMLRDYCEISAPEKKLLESNRRPIVLLKKRFLSALGPVAPANAYLGFMLPYTPLHYILLSRMERPLVMTSGNLSEEPIIKDNAEALKRLAPLVDAFLIHNRDIFMRADDSVMGTRKTQDSEIPYFIRRSRGYTPEPVSLLDEGPEVLGAGADLKNTFTITKGGFAIPGQHIGDMENYLTLLAFEESMRNLKKVLRSEPLAIAHDLHPDYMSTSWALGRPERKYALQHHYAHIGSVMAEHGLKEKVIGVAFDGTGYGTDGKLWGGEFLVCDIHGFERLAHLNYIPLPGGQKAIKEPWRIAVSALIQAQKEKAEFCLEALGFYDKYGAERVQNLVKMARSDKLSIPSSGAGRLFDAVSALVEICDINTFEAEAAMALEAAITEGVDARYPYELKEGVPKILDFSPAIIAITNDLLDGVDKGIISAKFHNAVAFSILDTVKRINSETGLKKVALSGGTFQNNYLLSGTMRLLGENGFEVFINAKVPCNDGGISLGQAYIIRERL